MARGTIRLALLVSVTLALAFFPVAAAHHGDTDLQAEDPAPVPLTLYHHYLLIKEELQALQDAHPDKFKFYPIGRSVLGLEMFGAEITNFAGATPPMEDRERIYFDGSIHSNEQLGMEMVMDIARFLLTEYDTNETARFIVDERQTFLVPIVNPDGNVRDSRQNVHLVDLNRNFPHGWGGPGSAAKGDAPASEPETQAVIAHLQNIRPHYLNSFHTGTLMLLHPYGNTEDPSPDHAMYTRVCDLLKDSMRAAHPNNRNVPCGQVYTTIYPASGTTVDYAYVEFGTNAWTFEVDGEQNLWASFEGIRTRLGEAWVAVEHAFLNVEKYGALLNVLEVQPIVRKGAVRALEAHLVNDGLGASHNAELRFLQDGAPALAVQPESLAPGETRIVTIEGTDLRVGDVARLELAYNKTFYRGFRDERVLDLQAANEDGHIVLRLVTPDGVPLAGGAADAPGPEMVVALSALAGWVWAGRRRRA